MRWRWFAVVLPSWRRVVADADARDVLVKDCLGVHLLSDDRDSVQAIPPALRSPPLAECARQCTGRSARASPNTHALPRPPQGRYAHEDEDFNPDGAAASSVAGHSVLGQWPGHRSPESAQPAFVSRHRGVVHISASRGSDVTGCVRRRGSGGRPGPGGPARGSAPRPTRGRPPPARPRRAW